MQSWESRKRRLKQAVAGLPKQPGVYQWKNAEGETLYVGKAIDLRSRTKSYLAGEQTAKTQQMLEQAWDLEYIAVGNEKEALLLEQTLIKRLKPRYNVRLTDGRNYPYIKLSAGKYPRLLKVHQYTDDGGTYFGPFPDGYGAYHVMNALHDIFPLRRCKTVPKHKCLYYDIGKCIAPCIDACTDAEYDVLVQEVRNLLRGKSKGLLKSLEQKIECAALEKRYEDAGRLRDQLRGLRGVLERQHMLTDKLQDRDIIAMVSQGETAVVTIVHQRDGKIIGQSPFNVQMPEIERALEKFMLGHYADRVVPRFVTVDLPDGAKLEADLRLLAGRPITVETPQKGEKMRWLDVATTNANLRLQEETIKASRRGMGAVEALQTALGLQEPPRIIEGFDISHHAGEHTRAAMVRFVDGEPGKAGYRTFAMKTVGETAVQAGTAASRGKGREVDDFGSMQEAVSRRIRGLIERGDELPDLIVVDGGKGQLSAARTALQEHHADVALCSLAKREEEVFVPGKMNPIILPKNHAGLQLLQRVRDESHRFGITQVRAKATSGVRRSPLDHVVGIGPKKRATLVQAFGGLDGLRAATVEDVEKVPGITSELAKQIVAALQA